MASFHLGNTRKQRGFPGLPIAAFCGGDYFHSLRGAAGHHLSNGCFGVGLTAGKIAAVSVRKSSSSV